MEQPEIIIDSQPITAKVKCGFFSAPIFVYYILDYTSKASWHVHVDPDRYDKNCKCYSKDPNKLIPNEIAKAKSVILERIKNKVSTDRINRKAFQKKQEETIAIVRPKPDLMRHKNITIKTIDWK